MLCYIRNIVDGSLTPCAIVRTTKTQLVTSDGTRWWAELRGTEAEGRYYLEHSRYGKRQLLLATPELTLTYKRRLAWDRCKASMSSILDKTSSWGRRSQVVPELTNKELIALKKLLSATDKKVKHET